jgi:hypothetical protein
MKWCAVLVVAFVVVLYTWASWVQRTPPHGRYTASQILSRSEALCRLLAPSTGFLRMSADSCAMPDRNGRMRHFWSVDCDDAANTIVAAFLWDADTGDLLCAGRPHGAAPNKTGLPPLSRRQAIGIAREGMRALEIAGQARQWRLEGARNSENGWRVRWQAKDRSAYVHVDAYTGELFLAQVILSRHPVRVAAMPAVR